MTKHTEGPWEVERVNKADLRITAPSRHIAKLVRYGSAVEQNMDFGNAALIAAAPDMLEALEEAERVLRWAAQESQGKVNQEMVRGWVYHADKITSAINKAKGAL